MPLSGQFFRSRTHQEGAEGNGILVGPGRGSVGGSLVAYLMGITDCDPIRFGLMFERFIKRMASELTGEDRPAGMARQQDEGANVTTEALRVVHER